MDNFMAIDIHTLTNRKKSYGHVGNGFISGKKTIWKIAPSSPAKPIVGIELKYQKWSSGLYAKIRLVVHVSYKSTTRFTIFNSKLSVHISRNFNTIYSDQNVLENLDVFT